MSSPSPSRESSFVFFDCETLPCPEDDPVWAHLRGMMGPDGKPEEAYKHLGLTSVLGRVWMIGLALRSKEPEIFRPDPALDPRSPEAEADVLKQFGQRLEEIWKENEDVWFVGHNVQGFDIPFLQARATVLRNRTVARAFGSSTMKPWERRVIDTLDLWPRTSGDRQSFRDWGLRGITKLDTLCMVLGVERQGGVMGEDVYEAFLRGDADGVAEHLRLDVAQTRDVFRKLFILV